MNGVIRVALLLILGSGSMLLFELGAESQVPQNWKVQIPENEPGDETSVIYRIQSDLGGKHYQVSIYGHDLESVVKWKDRENFPIGISDIKTKAQNAFNQQFPQFAQFKMTSINLVHLTIVDDWIVVVEFKDLDPESESREIKKLNLVVLLDGRVIIPTANG